MAVRLSLKNLSHDGKILNVPLFMIDELKRLMSRCKYWRLEHHPYEDRPVKTLVPDRNLRSEAGREHNTGDLQGYSGLCHEESAGFPVTGPASQRRSGCSAEKP